MADFSRLRFEWDETKATRNARVHGVSFQEGQSVFGDALARILPDTTHSLDEERYLLIGRSTRGRFLTVVIRSVTQAFELSVPGQ